MLTKIDRIVTNTTLLLGALAVAGAGLLGTGGTSAQTPEAKGTAASDKAAKDAEATKTFEVQGRVLGLDGKPVANAEVFVCARWAVGSDVQKDKREKLPSARASTDADGKYRFAATQVEIDQNLSVVATAKDAKDLGPDWVPLTRLDRGGGLPDLRLVKDDVPISGRVLDLESQPVAGATVSALRVMKAPGENLWPFFGAWSRESGYKRNPRPVGYEEGVMTSLEADREVKTGADGTFSLGGFGRDRVVVLAVEGPGLERRVVEVVTRATVPKGVPTVRAAKGDYLLAPAKPISGVVRDKATGKPATGVRVACFAYVLAGGVLRISTDELVGTTTDADGRYRLAGVAKAKEYYLVLRGGPFIRAARAVDDTPGLEPIAADFEVERGLEVRGRLTDKTTGRPVRGYVEYHARVDNPDLKDYLSFTKLIPEDCEVVTERDGSFSVAALPGPGVIVARAWENRFRNGWSTPDVHTIVHDPGLKPGSLGDITNFHAILTINPSENDPKSLKGEIALDPGQTLTGTVVGPDGKPLTGTLAWGLTPAFGHYELDLGLPTLRTAAFVATGLDERNPRYLVFWHREKDLGRAVLVFGDEFRPLTVRLDPLGTVTGRLVDQDGKPLAGVHVASNFFQSNGARHLARQFPGLAVGEQLDGELQRVTAETDSDGRFRLTRLVPGLTYDLTAHASVDRAARRLGDFLGGVALDLPAPTGTEPKNLGTITLGTKKLEAKKP